MSVSELPAAGTYRHGDEEFEIVHSKRGRWYAMKIEADGSKTYVAQSIPLLSLTGLRPGIEEKKSERQSNGCTFVIGCDQPVIHRGLCGLHLTTDVARKLGTSC